MQSFLTGLIMNKYVLLIDDGNIQHTKIASCISGFGANYLILNTNTFLSPGYSVYFNYNNGFQGGVIKLDNGTTVDLDDIHSIYVRGFTFDVNALLVEDSDAKRWGERESKSNLISLIEMQGKKVINSPVKSMVAGDKLTQMKIATEVGLSTPKTIITNNPQKLLKFRDECKNQVVFKSTCPPIIDTLKSSEPKTIYTNILSNSDYNLEIEISSNLSLYQQYIEKKYEIRVIVVGQRIFACEIHSQENSHTKVDWRRYNLDETPHYKHNLPDDIKNKLLRIIKRYNLLYGAFDLIVTPEDEYVYLELNPDGIYDWVEVMTGTEISKAIAEELIGA